jgi:hypothetical protein
MASALDAALARVLVGDEPLVVDVEDLGQIAVKDPFDGRTRTKVINIKCDPVGRMHKRGQLSPNGDTRLQAARYYQHLWDRAEIGGARAIDTTKDKVDGGVFQMPDSERRQRAQAERNTIERRLGEQGVGLVRLILIHGLEICELHDLRSARSAREMDNTGHRFRECLDTIAEVVGLFGRASGPRRPIDDYATLSQAAGNPELHRAIHRAKRRD